MKHLKSRHWIFLGLFLVIGITMILNVKLNVRVSPYTQKMFDYIDSLPPGSILLISFDHEASSLPEIRPLALAVLRHAFKKDLRLIGVSLLSEGTVIGYRLMQKTAKEYHKVYGKDYVYLGFRPQYVAAILSMGESLKETYPQDYLGNKYDQLNLLKSVKNYNNIDAVISIADGSLTTHWIEYGHGRYGVKILGAVTAAMVTTYDPYLASGQMYAMTGGLRGAAEYEELLKISGGGARGMLAQSSAHLYVIFLIIVGNLSYFITKRKGRK
ncbi:MAG: hypothetical protein GXO93_02560 [FCB group bacterium]|nr:hypothetical protein [FCB group bacterium]